MEEFHYEILMLKYANYVARELQERARRFQLDFDGILPPSDLIISKEDMNLSTYIYTHGDRNLLSILITTVVVAKPPPQLEKAIRELDGTTSHLTDYLIPLEVGGDVDYIDTYLVKEECIVRVKRMDSAIDFIHIKEDSKFKDLINSVVQMIGCYYTMNDILSKNEGRMRLERYIDSLAKERENKTPEDEKREKEEDEQDEDVNFAYNLARRFEEYSNRHNPSINDKEEDESVEAEEIGDDEETEEKDN